MQDDPPFDLAHMARLRVIGPADLANGAWPAHAPTPYTQYDICNLPDTEGHSNLWLIGRWLVEQTFDAALYENLDRLLAPDQPWHRGGFIDLLFRRDVHQVAFNLTWRGRMQSALGDRM